jgi:VanZ family protein
VSVRFVPPRACRSFAWASLTVAWAAVIFVLSAQPNLRFVPDATLDYSVRKAGHVLVFGLLAVFAWRTLSEARWPRPPAAWALLATILYAASDELHQGMVEGRHPSLVDVGIDALGAGAGLVLVTRIARRWGRSGR